MLRAIFSVIVGYVVMALWVFATLAGAWFVLGSEFAHGEGTEASTGWSVLMLAMGLVGAVLGGLVCASIGRAAAPVKVLAGIVLVVGLAFGVLQVIGVGSDDAAAAVPPEEMTMLEAMEGTKPPTWYSLALPFVGCAGVVLGGRMRRGGGPSGPTGEVAPP